MNKKINKYKYYKQQKQKYKECKQILTKTKIL